jgi:alpha-1,2-mannosyltransferase
MPRWSSSRFAQPSVSAVGAMGVLVFALLSARVVWLYLFGPGFDFAGNDFEVYRDGGESLLTGRSLYDHATPSGLRFTYTPFAAMLFVPLVLLPFTVGYYLWILLIFAVLAWIVNIVFDPLLMRFRRWRPLGLGLLTGLFVNFDPIRIQILFGEIDLFLMALVLATYRARRHFLPQGALIGLAAGIKLTPAIFIVLAFVTRRGIAYVAAFAAAATAGLGALVLPRTSWDFWGHRLWQPERIWPDVANLYNQSLRGVLARFDVSHLEILWATLAVPLCLTGLITALWMWQRGAGLAGLATAGITAALVSPFAWLGHFSWLIAALAVFVGDGRRWHRTLWAAVAFVLLSVALHFRGPALVEAGYPVVGHVAREIFFVASVTIVSCLVFVVRRDTDRSPQSRQPQDVSHVITARV